MNKVPTLKCSLATSVYIGRHISRIFSARFSPNYGKMYFYQIPRVHGYSTEKRSAE